MQREFKTPSIPFPIFNLLQTVMMEKSQEYPHKVTTEGVFAHFKEKALDTSKPYSIQQFYPFFWLLTFAQTVTTDNLPQLNIDFKPGLDNGGLGEYRPIDHSINVKIIVDEKENKIDSETTARVLMHESTHALTTQIYGTPTPPEVIWGNEVGLAFRISLLSMFLSPSEGNFMQLDKAENKDQYTLASYPQEFIAETIAYTIKNGALPLNDFLFPKDKENLTSAIETFLQDCKAYLSKLINESGLSKVMPWLAECDWSSPHLMIPLNELNFFLSFMRTGSLWQAAFIAQDVSIVGKLVSIYQTSSYPSTAMFAFPADVFAALPESTFKTQVEQMMSSFFMVQSSAPSAPSAPCAEWDSEPGFPPSSNPAWDGESNQPSADLSPALTHQVRFGFQPSLTERQDEQLTPGLTPG